MRDCYAFDVAVIGGGPAGLAAAVAAQQRGAKTLVVEREERLGGILKQCVHDGFGLVRYGERLSGPEYALRDVDACRARPIDVWTRTFVTDAVTGQDGRFTLTVTTREGMKTIDARAVVLATGCRERTAKQVFIHGTRPAGVFTAGTAQHYVNLMGLMPTKRCVILGSGDIGLIMARRLTLEGAQVLGVYEIMPTPSGLSRNIAQCLDDFGIPLHLSHAVTRVFGADRLTAVEICQVDEKRQPMMETARIIECDALILSVGLIPENEIAELLHVPIDRRTAGPNCDNRFMTDVPGVYACGNCLHVNDLVDYVSESGTMAGAAAADEAHARSLVPITLSGGARYVVPQKLDGNSDLSETILYFRVGGEMRDAVVTVTADGREVYRKRHAVLRPPEMERIRLDLSACGLKGDSTVTLAVTEAAE